MFNKTPEIAVKNGICYLSEDRKRYGLLLNKSVAENTVIASLDKFSDFGFLNTRKINRQSEFYNCKLKTKTPSILQEVKSLSGGNQQKVILARWLLKNCDIFICRYFYSDSIKEIASFFQSNEAKIKNSLSEKSH